MTIVDDDHYQNSKYMKIAEGHNVRLKILDIETLKGMFDAGFYDPDKKEWTEFKITERENDLYKFINFYESGNCDYYVTFNGISFDHQVLQFILNNYPAWYDFSNLEITGEIYRFTQRLIDDQSYGIFIPYREDKFPLKSIDLFKIHHFDNEARRTSLKWCAFMMNMDVEEMPIHHNTAELSENEVETIIGYRRNDIAVTTKLLDLTIGITNVPELADYQGKNKIQDRFDVMNETGMQCLNWSDVKIGEEWNKLDYKRAEKILDREEYKLYPTRVKQPYGQKFGKYFPKTTEFVTKHLQMFTKSLGDSFVLAKKQEFPVKVGDSRYIIAKGGIHSGEANRMILPANGYILRDADVGSQYPRAIDKYEIYPPHLKSSAIGNFREKIEKRIQYKDKAKKLEKEGKRDEARSLVSVQGMLKLCMNGGYYGKLNQRGSFLEYPEGAMKVTIGCQMEILMLIEMLEEAGIRVVSGNTDGVLSYFPAEMEEEYNEICQLWEKKVGNDTLGKLEFTDFKGIWQESVNSYVALKSDGELKKKGRFVTVYGSPGCEINKNKSGRIIPLTLESYFIHKKDPIEFIKSHANIFDFCIAKKAGGEMHYEEEWKEGKELKTKVHKKLVRYFISNSGTVLYKRGFNYKGEPMNNHCEAIDKEFPETGQPLVIYFNKFFPVEKFSDYNINYNYYILETLKRIDNIEKSNKAKKFVESIGPDIQGKLF